MTNNRIVFIIGDSHPNHYLIQHIIQRFPNLEFKIVIQKTNSFAFNVNKVIKRIKRYGLIKVIDEIIYKLFETYIQRSADFYKKELPVKYKIPNALSVLNPNQVEVQNLINTFEPAFIIVCKTSILKPQIYQLAKVAAINIHPGINPKYRGYGNFWALYNEDFENIGYTVHHIDEGIDTGKICLQVRFSYEKRFRKLPVMRSETMKKAAKSLEELLLFYMQKGCLPEINSIAKDNGYFTSPGFSNYIKMLFKLNFGIIK